MWLNAEAAKKGGWNVFDPRLWNAPGANVERILETLFSSSEVENVLTRPGTILPKTRTSIGKFICVDVRGDKKTATLVLDETLGKALPENKRILATFGENGIKRLHSFEIERRRDEPDSRGQD
jgi:hypothetical protein